MVDTRVLGTGWCHPGAPGGITLVTSADDAEEARALLQALAGDYRPELPPDLGEEERCEPCPECGSEDKDFERERPVELVVRLLFQARSHGVTGPPWRCRECDYRWQVGDR